VLWISAQVSALIGGFPAGFRGFTVDSSLHWLGRLGAVLGVVVIV
jgi:hypothetical protein